MSHHEDLGPPDYTDREVEPRYDYHDETRFAEVRRDAGYGCAPSPSAARLRRELNDDAFGCCRICGADATMVCDSVVHAQAGASAKIDPFELPPAPANLPNPKQAQGDKKAPVWCVPPALTLGAAKALGEGVVKYGAYNWRTTKVEAMTYVAAFMRHGFAFMDGEDVDPESPTGKLHLEGMAACIAILLDAWYGDFLIDNRPPKGPAPAMTRAPTTTTKAAAPRSAEDQAEFDRVVSSWYKPIKLPPGTVVVGPLTHAVRAGSPVYAHDIVQGGLAADLCPGESDLLAATNHSDLFIDAVAYAQTADNARRLAAEERLRASKPYLTPSLPQLPGHHDQKDPT